MGRKRDSLKEYIELAEEAYSLGHTPSVPPSSRQVATDAELAAPEMDWSGARLTILQHGIDVKYILSRHIAGLTARHGSKRGDRFLDWLAGRPLSSFSHWHRLEIQADKKELRIRLERLRGRALD